MQSIFVDIGGWYAAIVRKNHGISSRLTEIPMLNLFCPEV